jgi:hypothetical protein
MNSAFLGEEQRGPPHGRMVPSIESYEPMINFADFFIPYILFLRGATYNIAQTITGLKPRPLTFVIGGAGPRLDLGYFVPIEVVASILLLYSFLLVGLIVGAAYVWGRWRGVLIALFLLALPGFAVMVDLWPNIRFQPETIVLGGTGTLGSPWGMFPLISMGLLTGWSLVLILTDSFGFRDNFRNGYDHLWYAMAILAGIFFVADADISAVVQELQEENQSARQASAYLLQQVRTYDLQCQQLRQGRRRSGARSLPPMGTVACAWTSDVQQRLNEYATMGARLFPTIGPKSSSDIYSPFGYEISPQQILTLRYELQAYNDSRCPVKVVDERWRQGPRPSATCQRPPSRFCASYPEPLDGHVNEDVIIRAVAIASECVIPSLVASRARQEKLSAVVADQVRTKHYRWLFFIGFSLIVGGKVANATSRAIELDKRPEQEKRRIFKLLWSVGLGAKKWVGLLIKAGRAGFGHTARLLSRDRT